MSSNHSLLKLNASGYGSSGFSPTVINSDHNCWKCGSSDNKLDLRCTLLGRSRLNRTISTETTRGFVFVTDRVLGDTLFESTANLRESLVDPVLFNSKRISVNFFVLRRKLRRAQFRALAAFEIPFRSAREFSPLLIASSNPLSFFRSSNTGGVFTWGLTKKNEENETRKKKR